MNSIDNSNIEVIQFRKIERLRAVTAGLNIWWS